MEDGKGERERDEDVHRKREKGVGVFTWPLISISGAFQKQIKPFTIVQPFEVGSACACWGSSLEAQTNPLNKYPKREPPS